MKLLIELNIQCRFQEAVHEILEKIGSSFENEMKTDTQTQLFPHGFGIDENQQLPLNVHQQVTTAARELHFSVDFAGEHFDLINFDNNTIRKGFFLGK